MFQILLVDGQTVWVSRRTARELQARNKVLYVVREKGDPSIAPDISYLQGGEVRLEIPA